MTLVLKDRVKETTSVVGTGSATLLGAVTKYHAFSVIGNANTTHYAIIHRSLGEWEVGIGTYTLAGTLLSRNTVLDSSASGAKVSFSAGTKDVICTYPAGKAVFQGGDLGIPLTGNLVNCTGVQANSFKNRIINGAMKVDQRNDGATIIPTITNTYSLDRWHSALSLASKFSINQGNATNFPGFTNLLTLVSLSAYTVAASDFFAVGQRIEGTNINDLAFGTSDASTITLSFWVQSTIAGTYGGSFTNNPADRSFPFSYVINAINTWEYQTITVPGNQSGNWNIAPNTVGISVNFSLGAGVTFSAPANGTWQTGNFVSATGALSLVGTTSAILRITGVQLEKGSIATEFNHLDYGAYLSMCQRYCQVINTACRVTGMAYQTIKARTSFPHTVPTMRPASDIALTGAASTYSLVNSSYTPVAATVVGIGHVSVNSTDLDVTVASGLVAGNSTAFNPTGTSKVVINCDF
jgi:hypothetical protein